MYSMFAGLSASHQPPCLDSGASFTFFQKAQQAVPGTYNQGSQEMITLAAGKAKAKCLGTGSISLGNLEIPDALHVEGMNGTLVSVSQICDQDKIVVFTKKEAIILDTSSFAVKESLVLCTVPRHDSGLYHFKAASHTSKSAIRDPQRIQLIHRRFIHANEYIVRKSLIEAKRTNSMNFNVSGKLKVCHPCQLGKAHRKPFKGTFTEASYPGEVVHADLDGPLPASHDGHKYLCSFVDQSSRYIMIATFCAKSDAENAFEMYKASTVVKCFPKGIQRLHTDGGGEFVFADNQNSMEHTSTTTNTPQHNPFAERVNRTIFDPVRTLLEESGLSKKYWDHAAQHVAYVKNRLHTKTIKKSPYEIVTGNRPPLHYVRVFGCASFIYNEDPESKVHARATPGIYLGSDDNGIFKCEVLKSRKIVYSRNVTFDEEQFPAIDFAESSSSSGESDAEFIPDVSEEETTSDSDEFSISSSSELSCEYIPVTINEEIGPVIERNNSSSITPSPAPERRTHPSRNRTMPDRFNPSAQVARHFAGNIINIPITTADSPTIKQALEESSPEERQLWIAAIEEELQNLDRANTWKSIGNYGDAKQKRMLGKKLLPTHLVLKVKRNENGDPIRFKNSRKYY